MVSQNQNSDWLVAMTNDVDINANRRWIWRHKVSRKAYLCRVCFTWLKWEKSQKGSIHFLRVMLVCTKFGISPTEESHQLEKVEAGGTDSAVVFGHNLRRQSQHDRILSSRFFVQRQKEMGCAGLFFNPPFSDKTGRRDDFLSCVGRIQFVNERKAGQTQSIKMPVGNIKCLQLSLASNFFFIDRNFVYGVAYFRLATWFYTCNRQLHQYWWV